MPDTTNAGAHSSQPTRVAAGQQPEVEQRALDFLAKVVRVPGVRVNREEFLRQELRKLHLSDDVIARAIDLNPLHAGVSLTAIDRLAGRQSPTKRTSRRPSPSSRVSPVASRCLGRFPRT